MKLLAGCSFTDPLWQNDIPWSVEFAKHHSSYIIAKAGMGIKGICTESLAYLRGINNVDTVIIMLPTLWRVDVEVDKETYLCNAMVDLLTADKNGYRIKQLATRKWLTSGGLNYRRDTEQAPHFDFIYKHQGFLVIIKEHLAALQQLIYYCLTHKVKYYITAIQDPMDQLTGLDYIAPDIAYLLDEVGYKSWIRFDGVFVDRFLGTTEHPTTKEHCLLSNKILECVN